MVTVLTLCLFKHSIRLGTKREFDVDLITLDYIARCSDFTDSFRMDPKKFKPINYGIFISNIFGKNQRVLWLHSHFGITSYGKWHEFYFCGSYFFPR